MGEKRRLVWDNCVLLGEIYKSNRTKLKVELVARDGIKYINVREWYMRKRDEVWKPGLTGFAIPIALPINENIEMPAQELLALMNKGMEMAADFAIEDPDNAVWYTPKAKE